MSGIAVEGVGEHYGREERVSGLPLNKHSNALAASIVCKSGPGALFGFTVLNTKSSAQYVQVFDAQALPSDGAVPAVVFYVPATSHLPIEWVTPRAFLTGLVLCNSSTSSTKTIGSADCFFDVQYV